MNDRLIRGVFPEENIRFAACQAATLCNVAVSSHQADWVSGWLLSEALTCATLLSIDLTDGERLTLRWEYPGPLGSILADVDENAGVRGFTQRLRLMPEVATLAEAISGQGRIGVISSYPNREGRKGITPAIFCDVARDLAHFLSLSFQVETALVVGLIMPPEERIALKAAVGLLLQPLPGCDPEYFDQVRQGVERPDFREWLEASPHRPEEVVENLPVGGAARYLDESTPSYHCHCNHAKVEAVLRMLEPEELLDMLTKDGEAQVTCHFCAKNYAFSRPDLENLLRQSQSGHA